MFIVSFANVLCIYPKLCLQVSSAFWLRTYLINQYVIFSYETISMVICPSSRFKLIILWPKINHLVPRLSQNASYRWGALVPFWILRHSFLSLTDCSWLYNIQLKTSRGGTLSAPFWCLRQKLSLSPLYFNKTLLHKSSEWSSLVSGPRLNSSPLGPRIPAS